MVAPSATPWPTSLRIRSSCTGATIAPMSIALSSGGPTRSFSIRARNLVTSGSATPSCTSRRDPAQHTCPWLNQIASTTPSTTLSRSASSNTMKGLFPPSSSDSFLPEPAVALRMIRPTSVEPVKAILSTSGCITSSSPVRPSPVTTFNTPGGSPAWCAISAKHRAVSGVNSAGLSTTVFPAASPGAARECRPGGEGLAGRGDGRVHVRRAGLGHARQLHGRRGVDDVESLAALPFGPATTHEQAEITAVLRDPLERLLIAFGGRPIGHRFEDLGYRRHAVPSDHRLAMRGRVAPRHEVLQLALDVGEQTRGAEAEQLGPEPPVAH